MTWKKSPTGLGLALFPLCVGSQNVFLVYPLFGPDDLGLEVEGAALGLLVDVKQVVVVLLQPVRLPKQVLVGQVEDLLGLVQCHPKAEVLCCARLRV